MEQSSMSTNKEKIKIFVKKTGIYIRLRLADEYRQYLIQALQRRADEGKDFYLEYDISLTFEAMNALDRNPIILRMSEFLLVFDESTQNFIHPDTKRLISIDLDIDWWMKHRLLQTLNKKYLPHG